MARDGGRERRDTASADTATTFITLNLLGRIIDNDVVEDAAVLGGSSPSGYCCTGIHVRSEDDPMCHH